MKAAHLPAFPFVLFPITLVVAIAMTVVARVALREGRRRGRPLSRRLAEHRDVDLIVVGAAQGNVEADGLERRRGRRRGRRW